MGAMKVQLPARSLGTGGPRITEVGFGAQGIGGRGYGYGANPQGDADSVAAIKHAVERGVNWVDTAAGYGLGHSEEVVGRAVREIPAGDRPLVFTKGGIRWFDDDPRREPVRDLRPESIRRGVEASLRRLGVDHIDLYQLHWPDEIGTPVEESWGEMARLVGEGKVRLAGVANFGVGLLERAERVRHVDSLQTPFCVVSREAGAELIGWARRNGTGVIVYSPMQSGLLIGRFSRQELANLDDRRRQDPEYLEHNLSRTLALVEELRTIAARLAATLPELAVAWTLSWPGVTGAVVSGSRSPEQVDGWVKAPFHPLTPHDLDDVAQALTATSAGRGPARPPA